MPYPYVEKASRTLHDIVRPKLCIDTEINLIFHTLTFESCEGRAQAGPLGSMALFRVSNETTTYHELAHFNHFSHSGGFNAAMYADDASGISRRNCKIFWLINVPFCFREKYTEANYEDR